MKGYKCQRKEKLVPSTRNRPKHNARNMINIKGLGECLLKVKGVKLQRQNDTRLSSDENKDEGLYNKLKVWKPALGLKNKTIPINSYNLRNKTIPVNIYEYN